MGQQQSFSGSAVQTSLTANAGATDAVLYVASTSGMPDTKSGTLPFVVTLDKGTPAEEKVLIQSYTSSALTVATSGRGYDGTTAQPHNVPATVQHTIDGAWHEDVSAKLYDGSTLLVPTGAASTVDGPDTYGEAAAVGTSTEFARADHKHGLPAAPAVTLAEVEGVFTASRQILVGTGNGSGALVDLNPNLLFNSSGERGLDGWTELGGTWSTKGAADDPTAGHVGVPGYFLDQGNGNGPAYLEGPAVECAGGDTFALSGIASTSGTGQGTSILELEATSDGTTWTSVASVNIPANSAVAHYECSGTVPAGTIKVRPLLVSAEGTASTENYFWLLKLEIGSVATPWTPSAVGQPWTSYTPTISGSGWALGNGTLQGAYRQIDAKTVAVKIQITTGSTTTIGSGALAFSLPPGMSAVTSGSLCPYMVCNYYNGSYNYGASIAYPSGSNVQPMAAAGTGNIQLQSFSSGAISPPSGSRIAVDGVIEIA